MEMKNMVQIPTTESVEATTVAELPGTEKRPLEKDSKKKRCYTEHQRSLRYRVNKKYYSCKGQYSERLVQLCYATPQAMTDSKMFLTQQSARGV
jgi:hypothetical protein